MLAPGDGVVVGISGGVDSVSLLSALLELQEEFQLTISAIHINHNLRGKASARDERLVQALCDKLEVPLFTYQANVMDFAADNKLGIEEAGRKLRYKYLHQTRSEVGAVKIAVGHNQDDSAETLLLNLFRGTGLRGLCGIPPVNGSVIRPLIEVSRSEIETYAEKKALPYTIDETNAGLDYNRNVIRNSIMPLIHSHFGNTTSDVIARNALFMRDEEDFLDSFSREKSGMLAYRFSCEKILLIEELVSLPVAIARRVIRAAISELRCEMGLEDITFSHVESIIDIARGRTGREVSLPGFKARREYEHLILYKEQENSGFCYVLEPDSPIRLTGLTVTLSLNPTSHYTHSFNYDKVNMPLELRTRHPGDRITLPGGTKKLQDYFTDTKTPRHRRDSTPLLAHGSDILWIMDSLDRINIAYQADENHRACWVTAIR